MNRIAHLLWMAALLLPPAAFADERALVGRWQAQNATIAIGACSAPVVGYCGVVTAHRLRADEVSGIGFRVLTGLVFDSGHNVWRGRSHDAEGSYDATIRLEGGVLVLRSCLAPGLCETDRWRRAP
jgi:hypothetical protein